MPDLFCDCGAALGEKDRMGDSSYACSKCGKALRGTAVQRVRAAAAKESNEAGQEWRFAKRLLVGVLIGSVLLGGVALAAAKGLGIDPIRLGEGVTTVAGLAIAGATIYAESARRRARKSEGKDPGKEL